MNYRIFVFLCFFSSSFLHAEETHQKSHHIGLGISAYMFQGDLSEQFNNTVGGTLEYMYTLPFFSDYEPSIGLRGEYFVPKRNGYENENILLTPQISMIFYKELFPLGASLGYDYDQWKQTKTFIHKEIFHEELLYGLALGLFTRTQINHWSHVEYTLGYHLQQFSFSSTFFTLGVQYVFDL